MNINDKIRMHSDDFGRYIDPVLQMEFGWTLAKCPEMQETPTDYWLDTKQGIDRIYLDAEGREWPIASRISWGGCFGTFTVRATERDRWQKLRQQKATRPLAIIHAYVYRGSCVGLGIAGFDHMAGLAAAAANLCDLYPDRGWGGLIGKPVESRDWLPFYFISYRLVRHALPERTCAFWFPEGHHDQSRLLESELHLADQIVKSA